MSSNIKSIKCHKALNSFGTWTISTTVELEDGAIGTEIIPDSLSRGKHEAQYLDVEQALNIVSHPINDLLVGKDPSDQKQIDDLMLEMDGTQERIHLGANSILSVSLAVAKASAKSEGLELFDYLNKLGEFSAIESFPVPMFNMIEGGVHSTTNLAFQEFLLIPSPSLDFNAALELGVSIYSAIREHLINENLSTSVGLEGGFTPSNLNGKTALKFLRDIANNYYRSGTDYFFGLDIGASHFYNHDVYTLSDSAQFLQPKDLYACYEKLIKEFELIYMEDPFYEGDVPSWLNFTQNYGDKMMIAGDDLMPNMSYLMRALEKSYANTVVVKLGQLGTLTEIFEFVRHAQKSDATVVFAGRSLDSGVDTFVSDLAVACSGDFIKAGAPSRGERVSKYNRLLEVFSALNL